MKSGIKIIVACIVLLAAAWVVHMFLIKNKSPQPTQPTKGTSSTVDNRVSYACKEGTFRAQYTDGHVALSFADHTTAQLDQTRAASGVRYQNDQFTFVTKGDYGFLQKGDTTIYSNCILSTDETTGSNEQTFTDGSKTFSFVHPNTVSISGGDIGYTQQWRVNAQQTLGLLLAQATIPQSTQPQTNFAGATFAIGTSSDPDAIKNCLIATNGERLIGTANLHGTTYQKFSLADAGAGNLYETTSYRTMHDSQCYAVEYTIHSTNLGNYSADQGISAFDRAQVTRTLDGMATSFIFLQ